MAQFEVAEPILNSPFAEPGEYWYLKEGEAAQKRTGRRPAIVFPPRDQTHEWDLSDGTLQKAREYAGYELTLVNLVRERLAAWRASGYEGATRTTKDLLAWWGREGRRQPLFFAQREAAEAVIFLTEARGDFLQGIDVPRETVSDTQAAAGVEGFRRLACKMATGSGKTTVMGMLIAWSILNKVHSRGRDARFSEVVLVVCPNVTIRNRLAELDPNLGEASIYATRDLVPPDLRAELAQGTVIVRNWHDFLRKGTQVGGETAKVNKAGVREERVVKIQIGAKSRTARGNRYLTLADYESQQSKGLLDVESEERDEAGVLRWAKVRIERYMESDTRFVQRVLEQAGGKKNLLVFNDEAHHAYRIKKNEPDEDEAEKLDDDAEDYFQEATVWIDGLDRINKKSGINLCVDLSATPYFLGRVGQDTNRPFPWVVSDFGLVEAIESGLTKIPQLAVRDTTGAEIPGYFRLWDYILDELNKKSPTSRRNPKPEDILQYASHAIAMLADLWRERLKEQEGSDDPRPPVFILVAKNTRISKVLYEWIGEDDPPLRVSKFPIREFKNTPEVQYTIRVDSRVLDDAGDLEGSKGDEQRWMRHTLTTVGRREWPRDRLGRALYPEGFEELAERLGRPLHPPGREVRCIVSVGMLTEGWDCNTVTHIVGLRPFQSQLLCEQVVGRALRRMNYDLGPDGKFEEETAKVFGVPFEVIPFKQSAASGKPRVKQHHIHALPERAALAITFPRVEGYTQAIRNRVTVDWDQMPSLTLTPGRIPPQVQMKGMSVNNLGRMSLSGAGPEHEVNLVNHRARRRMQELVFELAASLTKDYCRQTSCQVPPHRLFPQVATIVEKYVRDKVQEVQPADKKDLFLSPYYGWLVEVLVENLRPDTAAGESAELPRFEENRREGTTADVDYWTSKQVREIAKSHLNYIVADTHRWEQQTAYYLDTHPGVISFAKNAGLGFRIPYLYNGQMHDYVPDYLVRLKVEKPVPWTLVLETKGYFDTPAELKRSAAERWAQAVNAEGSHGHWLYRIATKPEQTREIVDLACRAAAD